MFVKKLNPEAKIPVRGTSNSAGYDLFSIESITLAPNSLGRIHTGIAVAVPNKCYGRIADRSSMASKSLHTFAGVIDSDYRGEIIVLLYNHESTPYTISKGDKVAQLILERILTTAVVEVEELDATDRGAGGFGHTGK